MTDYCKTCGHEKELHSPKCRGAFMSEYDFGSPGDVHTVSMCDCKRFEPR